MVERLCGGYDAAGSKTLTFLSAIDAGPLVLQFVDRYPERCSALIFGNSTACWAGRPDYQEGHSEEAILQLKDIFSRTWGQADFAKLPTPSQGKNEVFQSWYAKYQRCMASPRAVVENLDTLAQIDSRSLLSHVRVPTLVMAGSHVRYIPPAQGRYVAEHIPGARFVELPGADAILMWETPDLVLDLVEEFVTGRLHDSEPERALLTVLFTDIVGSTKRVTEIGDTAWRQLLDRHDQTVRDQIRLYRGRLIDSTGDGTLATFDNPRRAADCALALQEALAPLGIQIRAGLHTGEVELRDAGHVGGITVHVGARVMAAAGAGEVLVSRTVRDVLLGSRYEFQDRGTHELKGVPDQWQLYAVSERKSQ